jgi:hypothetical protein
MILGGGRRVDYFIDESGHTGDVARLDALSGFNDQPIFCLAAVGVANEISLEQEINRLREKHGIRLDELKSSARRGRPEFTYEVVRLVCTERYPFFLEVMDKKYYFAAHMTSRQLLPPIRGLAADPRTHYFQNLVADYLFDRLPDAVFAKFIEACLLPSHETLSAQMRMREKLLLLLGTWQRPPKTTMRKPVPQGAKRLSSITCHFPTITSIRNEFGSCRTCQHSRTYMRELISSKRAVSPTFV